MYLTQLTKLMKSKGNRFYDNDNINSLNIIICQFLSDTFNNCPLENRLKESYSSNIINKQPSYGFILRPDDNFLNKLEVRKILGNFRELKNQILKNQNIPNDDSFLNPFVKEEKKEDNDNNIEKEEEEEDYEYMDIDIWEIYRQSKTLLERNILPKKGVSLMTKKEKQILENKKKLFKRISSSDKIIINKNKRTFSSNEIKIRKKTKNKYTKLIKEIFCTKLNDFRSEIIIYCLKNVDLDILTNDTFEKFVCFLEFFITLYTGIRTKYYMDELSNLNMDFYADENNLMYFAETFRFRVQFKIKDIPIIYDSDLKLYKKRDNTIINKENFHVTKFYEINEINKAEFENFNWKRVEYFPPFTNFIKELSNHYRRYDINDKIHFCKECENLSLKRSGEVKCSSSCFKSLDKEKLIFRSLMTVMNDDNIEESWIIKDGILILNYQNIMQNTNIFSLIVTFLTPVETFETKRINKIYSNTFGEAVGFFFVWISHYIYWLIFPSIFGIIIHFLLLNKKIAESNYELILSLIFTGTIVLWGNYYVISWKKKNKFYNYIWGMTKFKVKKVINTDNRVSINRINFMGIKLPQSFSYKTHFTNVIILILSALLKIAMMGSNIIIMAYKNHTFDLKNPFYNKFLNKYWKYITPIIIYILRECFSFLSEKANIWLYSHQKFISEKEKQKMLVRKKLLFEFFNYYFNLYYIAFLKKNLEKCLYDNCYTELEQQLIMIILSDAIVICVQFYNQGISLRKEINKFEKEIQSKYSYIENTSNKFRYYTRYSFRNKSIIEYYLKIFLTFGYILQFGACCPVSFILVLFITILTRVTLGISLRDIYYVQIFDENTGLSIINQAQELISFIGIISNLFIIFYTNNNFVKIKTMNKFFYMILTENIIILITKFFEPFNMPNWFHYRNRLALQYYRKYGTRKKKIHIYQ